MQVLSIPPAWSQRHSTWPPQRLAYSGHGNCNPLNNIRLSTPEGNDWQVPIPATGLLQRSTACAHCTALADQMTKTPYYSSTRAFISSLLLGWVNKWRRLMTTTTFRLVTCEACRVCSLHTRTVMSRPPVAQPVASGVLQNTHTGNRSHPRHRLACWIVHPVFPTHRDRSRLGVVRHFCCFRNTIWRVPQISAVHWPDRQEPDRMTCINGACICERKTKGPQSDCREDGGYPGILHWARLDPAGWLA